MKIIDWTCFLFIAGFTLLHPCVASSSTEAFILTSSLGEDSLFERQIEMIDPVTTEVWLAHLRQDSTVPVGTGEEAIQVAIANVPPAPLEVEEEVGTIPDPIEPVNRAFFVFNDRLYFWIFKPIALGYKAVAPEVVRVSVRNFFSHITTPVRLANCLLQADVKCAGIETARFFLNTAIGFAGFFDSAKTGFNLEKQERDFGQTLGIWGMGPVFYLDLPILGPSSLRDGLGYVVDLFFDPRTYLSFYVAALDYVNTGLWVFDKINEASLSIGEYEELKKAALDPYIALREAYHQYRQSKIKK